MRVTFCESPCWAGISVGQDAGDPSPWWLQGQMKQQLDEPWLPPKCLYSTVTADCPAHGAVLTFLLNAADYRVSPKQTGSGVVVPGEKSLLFICVLSPQRLQCSIARSFVIEKTNISCSSLLHLSH